MDEGAGTAPLLGLSLASMTIDGLTFFNPWAEIAASGNRLPHWEQRGVPYFVTFHLADSIPRDLREQLAGERAAWLKAHPKPWDAAEEREYLRRFSGAVERWLDAGHGACILRTDAAAAVVAGALRHFDGGRYVQHAWVVMPNHVHAVFTLHREWPLATVLHSWKSFTAHELVKSAAAAAPVWHEDYFDRLVRDAEHFENCVRYIRRNPAKAGLRAGEFTHYEDELAKSVK